MHFAILGMLVGLYGNVIFNNGQYCKTKEMQRKKNKNKTDRNKTNLNNFRVYFHINLNNNCAQVPAPSTFHGILPASVSNHNTFHDEITVVT